MVFPNSRRITNVLIILGALLVLVHLVALLFISCGGRGGCLAGIYFGVLEKEVDLSFNNLSEVSGATASLGEVTRSSFFVSFYDFIFVFGLSLFMVGVTLRLFLEINNLVLKRRVFR